MKLPLLTWQLLPAVSPPQWLIDRAGFYAAQLIWQRDIQSPSDVEAFLNPESYIPTTPFAFGVEMQQAVARIQQAWELNQKVAIWGDFDADGITATAVLWEGLSQFFPKHEQLVYYIPDRLNESHGLSVFGIDTLRDCQLIVTCDTGSTNFAEVAYARSQNIDVIITDHHTLPAERPPVCAIINPRYLDTQHPLYHLSGVAVAFKLIEALYDAMPEIPKQSLENLLDLVAIGLIADLVQLVGDCRYLAQKGIEVLKKKQRLGLKLLLDQCKKAGDRAVDISFGLAPRINSVSRMWGDVYKCVELLTSQDEKTCQDLAKLAEMANTQRRALQRKIYAQVQAKISQSDLSTAAVLVIDDPNWSVGILGLVAGQAASEYGRPIVLCNVEDGVARCSARSPSGIDLYELIKGQEHLITHFGGHPLAAGLSLPAANLDLFRESINQKFWSQYHQVQSTNLQIDLVVTIADLGQDLFRQFKQLEPFGMGQPSPKLLIRNCTFNDKKHANIKNFKNQKVEYIKSTFLLTDSTGEISGDWWGHYEYEIPDDQCDVVVELVDNSYKQEYEVRLVDIQPITSNNCLAPLANQNKELKHNNLNNNQVQADIVNMRVLDYRGKPLEVPSHILGWQKCPSSWQDINELIETSRMRQTVALAYPLPAQINDVETWHCLVGIAKYLSRTQKIITLAQLQQKINIYDISIIHLGLDALASYGWKTTLKDNGTLQIDANSPNCQVNPNLSINAKESTTTTLIESTTTKALQKFLAALNELIFRQKYFDQQTLNQLTNFLTKR